jgi:hypothetical protein
MKAPEIISWIQSACSDLAGGDEALADQNYDDKDYLTDLLHQAIYDETYGEIGKATKLVIEIRDYTWNPVIKEICKEYLKKSKVKEVAVG